MSRTSLDGKERSWLIACSGRVWKRVLSLKWSTPQDLDLREERKTTASQDLGGPILPRVDFGIQVKAMGKAMGQVSVSGKIR